MAKIHNPEGIPLPKVKSARGTLKRLKEALELAKKEFIKEKLKEINAVGSTITSELRRKVKQGKIPEEAQDQFLEKLKKAREEVDRALNV